GLSRSAIRPLRRAATQSRGQSGAQPQSGRRPHLHPLGASGPGPAGRAAVASVAAPDRADHDAVRRADGQGQSASGALPEAVAGAVPVHELPGPADRHAQPGGERQYSHLHRPLVGASAVPGDRRADLLLGADAVEMGRAARRAPGGPPMNRLDRYIGRQVFMSILAVLGVLWGLSLLFALIDELGFMRGTFGVPQVLEYVLLTSPRRLYELLPMGALIGCLIGLGTLASSSELTVMRASGVPLVRIVGAVMAPMLLLMALGLALSEFVMPKTEVLADFKRDMARNGGQAMTSKGLWHREGGQYVHINAARSDGVMLGIT